MTEELLALQAADTERDQVAHRLSTLPELEAAALARKGLATWERVRNEGAARLEVLAATIDQTESETDQLDQQRTRLEGQLRTVIAPREAEALQHEIATLNERRGELDDLGLAALEEHAEVDARLLNHAAEETERRTAVEVAERELAEAQSGLETEIEQLDLRIAQLRTVLPDPILQRYDRLRIQLGTAVAQLIGSDCVGCPSNLSPGEVEVIKAAPADEPVDCPQCGRLVVR
jgi:predicted  nucleic acid-binding Zn-ribbon protein